MAVNGFRYVWGLPLRYMSRLERHEQRCLVAALLHKKGSRHAIC